MKGPILHGIQGFGQVFVMASAYYVGTEIVSLAAGETKDPRRSIPQVFIPYEQPKPVLACSFLAGIS